MIADAIFGIGGATVAVTAFANGKRSGVRGASLPGPCVVGPPPTLQHLPCQDTRYGATCEYVPSLQPRATTMLARMYLCTSSTLPAPCSTSVSSRSRESTTTHTPAGTSHPSRQPRPRSPCPTSLSQLRLGQCFSFLPQSFHSILMWSYVLYHRPINPSSIRAAFWAVLCLGLVVASVAGAQLSYA